MTNIHLVTESIWMPPTTTYRKLWVICFNLPIGLQSIINMRKWCKSIVILLFIRCSSIKYVDNRELVIPSIPTNYKSMWTWKYFHQSLTTCTCVLKIMDRIYIPSFSISLKLHQNFIDTLVVVKLSHIMAFGHMSHI